MRTPVSAEALSSGVCFPKASSQCRGYVVGCFCSVCPGPLPLLACLLPPVIGILFHLPVVRGKQRISILVGLVHYRVPDAFPDTVPFDPQNTANAVLHSKCCSFRFADEATEAQRG